MCQITIRVKIFFWSCLEDDEDKIQPTLTLLVLQCGLWKSLLQAEYKANSDSSYSEGLFPAVATHTKYKCSPSCGQKHSSNGVTDVMSKTFPCVNINITRH